MAMSLAVTFQILGFEPFSGSSSLKRCFSESMSVQWSLFASPLRIAVSLSAWRKVAVRAGFNDMYVTQYDVASTVRLSTLQ